MKSRRGYAYRFAIIVPDAAMDKQVSLAENEPLYIAYGKPLSDLMQRFQKALDKNSAGHVWHYGHIDKGYVATADVNELPLAYEAAREVTHLFDEASFHWIEYETEICSDSDYAKYIWMTTESENMNAKSPEDIEIAVLIG